MQGRGARGPWNIGRTHHRAVDTEGKALSHRVGDGSPCRPYGETKDEDPTLRKHFTRDQIFAIMAFGDES